MLLYALYRIGQIVLLVLPLRFCYWLGSRIADLHYLSSKKDRDLILGNLKKTVVCDNKKLEAMGREVFRNFAKYLIEFLRFRKMGAAYLKKYVSIEGLDNLKEALKRRKGVIAFSAHLGNWEWGAAIIAQLGLPISVIALAHKDKDVNNFFIKQRAFKGVKNIPLGGSVKKALDLLSKNEIIGFLPDRDFSNNPIQVDFLGKPALMPIGIGVISVRSGCSLVPTFIIREKGNKCKLILDKPLDYTLTGSKASDIKNIVEKVTKSIEKYVKLYPEQWFMFGDPWEKAA